MKPEMGARTHCDSSEITSLICVMYLPESGIPLQPDILWQFNPQATAALFLALLSPRILPSAAGHEKRETLLAWLPEKLLTLISLEGLPERILHDVYMHCSYADMAKNTP